MIRNEAQNNTSILATVPEDSSFGAVVKMAFITEGKYKPLFGQDSFIVTINPFLMDVYPVSNTDFLAFTKKNKRWRKSQKRLFFSDGNYLLHWQNDTVLGKEQKYDSPVTTVSWFSANAYCSCQGKRLPTVDEWEYVAMANEKLPDARTVPSFNQGILDWYERPKTYNNSIGKTPKNYWGIVDLHGLVWEWTSDFNSVLLTGESRNDVSTDTNLFCGTAAINATDLMNYAAFMRYAFRASVEANYAVKNLGFRCAKDTSIVK